MVIGDVSCGYGEACSVMGPLYAVGLTLCADDGRVTIAATALALYAAPVSVDEPTQAQPARRPSRGQVVSWGFWDWGSAAFNAVVVTFVFSVYLTDSVGEHLDAGMSASSLLGFALAIAGFCVAVLAPVSGSRFDRRGRRRRALGVLTFVTVAVMLAMVLVRDSSGYFWLGLVLLAIGTVSFEIAEVPYNAMLRQVSTKESMGRVSGFGWAMGYFGGIVLLLTLYLGFIAGDGDTRGALGLTTVDGFNIRMAILVAAIWFALFAIPVLLAVPDEPRERALERVGFVESYRQLFADVAALWREERSVIGFLVASAVFRDGLVGVFTFGAVLAVNVYGISSSDVLLFGIAANVVAALGALVAGRFDDSIGPKTVIAASLVGTIVAGLGLLLVSGPALFWVFGLALCLFVGPAQSASRTFLARLAPEGREAEIFGLYATTGRAVSFLAPALFGLFTWLFAADRAGIVGIVVVLGLGLALLARVPSPSPVGGPLSADTMSHPVDHADKM